MENKTLKEEKSLVRVPEHKFKKKKKTPRIELGIIRMKLEKRKEVNCRGI